MAHLMNAKQPRPNPQPKLAKFIARLPIKSKTKAVGSAEERFVRAVRLASRDLHMKTGGGKFRISEGNLSITGGGHPAEPDRNGDLFGKQ
jgi:hypothetical protein